MAKARRWATVEELQQATAHYEMIRECVTRLTRALEDQLYGRQQQINDYQNLTERMAEIDREWEAYRRALARRLSRRPAATRRTAKTWRKK